VQGSFGVDKIPALATPETKKAAEKLPQSYLPSIVVHGATAVKRYFARGKKSNP